MPELDITIGGRVFQVTCQVGEESFLRAAAALLDAEANPLVAQVGRMPDARLLLLAGLMVADRTSGLEIQLRETQLQLADARSRITHLENRPAPAPQKIEVPVEVRVDVPVVPPALIERMAALATEVENMAEALEERAAFLADAN